MALHLCISNADGSPVTALINVTPTWWSRRKLRVSQQAVAKPLLSFPFAREVRIGVDGLFVLTLMGDPSVGAEINALRDALQALENEFADPLPWSAVEGEDS